MDLFGVDDRKAGMKGIDKESINRIIEQSTGSSRFQLYQQRQMERINKRIEQRQARLSSLTEDDRAEALLCADAYLREVEYRMDISSTIVHFDLDAFFCAVEILDCPRLANVPMAVGTNLMLCTSNYPARQFGIRAAMPGYIARRLCPDLTIIRPNMEKYCKASKQVVAIFREYDLDCLVVSIDEVYIDLTGFLRSNPSRDAFSTVQDIRERIKRETGGLTVSAGIACNMRLAKLCTDINKPDGQFMLPVGNREEIRKFISATEVRKINGIGKVTASLLTALGIKTCQDLLDRRDVLYLLEYRNTFEFLMRVATGSGTNVLHDRSHEQSNNRKTIGLERTFRPTSDTRYLTDLIHELCARLEAKLKKRSLKTKRITLKVKSSDFEMRTKARPLPYVTDERQAMFESANSALQEKEIAEIVSLKKIRLLGVRAAIHETICADICLFKSITKSFHGDDVNANEESGDHVLIAELDDPCEHDTDQVESSSERLFGGARKDERCRWTHQELHSSDTDKSLGESALKRPRVDGDKLVRERPEDMPIQRNGSVQFLCPVCKTVDITLMDNALMNEHLDECLTLKAIKDDRHALGFCPQGVYKQMTIDECFDSKRKPNH